MIQDFCGKMFCINLDSKPERWLMVKKEFDRLNIEVERFSAIKHEHRHIGCRMSHQAIVQKAKCSRWKRVLIFEDDVIFHKNALEIFDSAAAQLPKYWDLLYFGCRFGTEEKYSPNLSKIVSCKLGHAVIFDEHIYDIVLESKEKSMDRTNLLIHPRGGSFCINPMIADQENMRVCMKT